MNEGHQSGRMHIPVLKDEVLSMAMGLSSEPRWYLDATFGRGGHAQIIMQRWPRVKLVAMDRDSEAIASARQIFPQSLVFHGDFLKFADAFPNQFRAQVGSGFDLILVDLGVSSPQLDEGRRGFSFYHSGPLDMRMDTTQELTAADIVNTWPEDDLNLLFQKYGEVQRPFRVVQSILRSRQSQPFTTTQQLSTMIESIEGWRSKGQHPATRYFMALRLVVNNELEQVEKGLPRLIEMLAPGGRLMVITFHSLEDRIAKYILKESPLGQPVNKKVIQATWDEKKKNPRARSAKLRVFERKGAT